MTEDEESNARLEAIGKRLFLKAPILGCPFCKNVKWFFLSEKDKFPVIMLPDLNNYATYSLACTNCGFVRQHVSEIMDGEIVGEVEFAQSGSASNV